MIALYVLALVGLVRLPRRFLALTVLLLAYGTLMAMVFAGTVRYSVPWDFLLCVPAAFGAVRLRTEPCRPASGGRPREGPRAPRCAASAAPSATC